MRARALRGVCIGPERHLKPGDVADLDASTFQFLSSIKAVELCVDEPPKAAEPAPKVAVADAPKPQAKEK